MPASNRKPARRPQVPSANRKGTRRPKATRSIVVLLSTAPPSAAARIARALVGARVAACVNVVPGIASTYRWKGRIERAKEVLLVIKTTTPRIRACRRELVRIHPYDTPEVLVFRADAATLPYARWVDASTA